MTLKKTDFRVNFLEPSLFYVAIFHSIESNDQKKKINPVCRSYNHLLNYFYWHFYVKLNIQIFNEIQPWPRVAVSHHTVSSPSYKMQIIRQSFIIQSPSQLLLSFSFRSQRFSSNQIRRLKDERCIRSCVHYGSNFTISNLISCSTTRHYQVKNSAISK